MKRCYFEVPDNVFVAVSKGRGGDRLTVEAPEGTLSIIFNASPEKVEAWQHDIRNLQPGDYVTLDHPDEYTAQMLHHNGAVDERYVVLEVVRGSKVSNALILRSNGTVKRLVTDVMRRTGESCKDLNKFLGWR